MIAQNRLQVGIATMADVYTAQTQVDNAQAQLVTFQLTRDRMEHAIATLIGKTPDQVEIAGPPHCGAEDDHTGGAGRGPLPRLCFSGGLTSLLASEYAMSPPPMPEIGVAAGGMVSGHLTPDGLGFPGFGLLAHPSLGSACSRHPTRPGPFGPSACRKPVFNGGAREPQTDRARASRYDQAVATYRQTAF